MLASKREKKNWCLKNRSEIWKTMASTTMIYNQKHKHNRALNKYLWMSLAQLADALHYDVVFLTPITAQFYYQLPPSPTPPKINKQNCLHVRVCVSKREREREWTLISVRKLDLGPFNGMPLPLLAQHTPYQNLPHPHLTKDR